MLMELKGISNHARSWPLPYDMRVFLIFLLFSLIGLVIFLWLRERRYLKKKTSEAMAPVVWREVVAEREAGLKKRRLFRDTLEKAKHRR